MTVGLHAQSCGLTGHNGRSRILLILFCRQSTEASGVAVKDDIERFLTYLSVEKGFANNTLFAYRNDLAE